MRKVLLVAGIAMVIYGISQAPGPWADATENLGGEIAGVFRGWGQFFTRLAT